MSLSLRWTDMRENDVLKFPIEATIFAPIHFIADLLEKALSNESHPFHRCRIGINIEPMRTLNRIVAPCDRGLELVSLSFADISESVRSEETECIGAFGIPN